MQQRNLTEHVSLSGETELSGKALKVLQAARKVFLAHGFSAATTDMIQREAGVSKSTVYAHFTNKEALFTAVIKSECTAFTRALHNIRFQPGRLKETLGILARTYLDVVLSPSGLALYRVAIAESARFPALAHTFYRAGPQVSARLVADLLAGASQSGEVNFGDTSLEAAACMFVNLVRSELQLQYLTYPDSPPSAAQIDTWVTNVVTLFMRAYGGGDK